MDTARKHTDGVKGLVTTNGDLVDRVDWNDLENIQWVTINITDSSIEELAGRMMIIADRSNVIDSFLGSCVIALSLTKLQLQICWRYLHQDMNRSRS